MSDIHIIKKGDTAYVVNMSEKAKLLLPGLMKTPDQIGFPFDLDEWDKEIEDGEWIDGLTVKLIEE